MGVARELNALVAVFADAFCDDVEAMAAIRPADWRILEAIMVDGRRSLIHSFAAYKEREETCLNVSMTLKISRYEECAAHCPLF